MAPLSPNCLHVVIDMQRLFAEETVWHTPALMQILPNVTRLCQASGPRTVYAKFITPSRAETAVGQWQTYYRRWRSVTADRIDPSLFDLVAPLAELSRKGHVVEKTAYSVFGAAGFDALLAERRIDTLIFSGVETDVCVYASVLGAIDRGLRVILVTDAVASSDQAAHDAVIAHLLPRLPEQVEMVDTDVVLPALITLNRL
ncbi:MAG: cysteine hydrolase [Paracoccaceae bacterium]